MGRLVKYLVAWYGIWQAGHFAANAAHFTGLWRATWLVGRASSEQVEILVVSGYVDLVAAPLGVAFALGFFYRKAWALPVGIVSLSFAVYSAFAWTYLHEIMGTWPAGWGAVLAVWVPFLPHLVLFGVLLVKLTGKTRSADSGWMD